MARFQFTLRELFLVMTLITLGVSGLITSSRGLSRHADHLLPTFGVVVSLSLIAAGFSTRIKKTPALIIAFAVVIAFVTYMIVVYAMMATK